MGMVAKVVATQATLDLIELLKKKHGELMLHQSGGCCDNSAANCYLPGEITIGAGDVFLGEIDGCPFYIGKSHYEYWKHTVDHRRDQRPRWHFLAGRSGGQGLPHPLANFSDAECAALAEEDALC